MNLNLFGLSPVTTKSTYFNALDEVKRVRKLYHEDPVRDFRIFSKMTFINNMSCLKALKLLNSTFNLNLVAYKKLLRGYCVYFDGVIVQLSEIPFNVIVYIYNHIFWAQDSSFDEIKVQDIDMFRFEGI